jgi:hypothetical protein
MPVPLSTLLGDFTVIFSNVGVVLGAMADTILVLDER